MFTTIAQVVGALLAAVGGVAGIAAFTKIGPERRKINAEVFRAGVDSAQVLSSSALTLLKPALDQIEFLRKELAIAQAQVESLEAKISELQLVLARNGLTV